MAVQVDPEAQGFTEKEFPVSAFTMPPTLDPSTQNAQATTGSAVASTVISALKFFATPSVAEIGLIEPTVKVPTPPAGVTVNVTDTFLIPIGSPVLASVAATVIVALYGPAAKPAGSACKALPSSPIAAVSGFTELKGGVILSQVAIGGATDIVQFSAPPPVFRISRNSKALGGPPAVAENTNDKLPGGILRIGAAAATVKFQYVPPLLQV